MKTKFFLITGIFGFTELELAVDKWHKRHDTAHNKMVIGKILTSAKCVHSMVACKEYFAITYDCNLMDN